MSRNIIMLLEAVYFFVMLCLAHSTLLQSPEDTEAVVGENVTLKCRTDVNGSINPVEWSYKNVHTNALGEFVYKYLQTFKNICDRCEVVPDIATGQYDLIIRNVQPSDAGRYTCRDRQTPHQDAELIVFDRYPSNEFCTTTSTSNGNQNDCGVESVTMSCELRYRGNPTLSLEWRKEDSTIPSTVTRHPNGIITTSILLQKAQLETAKYTCRVKYHASAKTSRFTWSPTTNITPITTTTSVSYGGCDNKTVECSDGKSPDCAYIWKDENGTEVSSSSVMEMAGKPNGNYTCSATCKVLQTSCTNVAKIFNYGCHEYSTGESTSTIFSPGTVLPQESMKSSPGTTSLGIYIPVSIALVILVSIIILLAILGFQRSRRVSERTNENHNVNDVDAELGESNTIELAHLNGTKSQETDVMLTRNTQTS